MKKIILSSVLVLITASFCFAQKFAFVDTDYILKNVPDYQAAQDKLDEFSVEWQKEIEAKFAEIDKMYKAYQSEAVLLPEDMKKKREDEIVSKEKEAKELQKQKFGTDGELFKKRQELIKPIQDKIYEAVQEIATQGGYAVVFDKAGSVSMLYYDLKYDKSDDVLNKLGYGANPSKDK